MCDCHFAIYNSNSIVAFDVNVTEIYSQWWSNLQLAIIGLDNTVYPKKYAHGFIVLCFVVVM